MPSRVGYVFARADMEPVLLVLGAFALARAVTIATVARGGYAGVVGADATTVVVLVATLPPWAWVAIFAAFGVAALSAAFADGAALAPSVALAGIVLWSFHVAWSVTLYLVAPSGVAHLATGQLAYSLLLALVSLWIYLRAAWTPPLRSS